MSIYWELLCGQAVSFINGCWAFVYGYLCLRNKTQWHVADLRLENQTWDNSRLWSPVEKQCVESVCVCVCARGNRQTEMYADDGCVCAAENWRAQWGEQISLEGKAMKLLVRLISLSVTTACHMTSHDCFTSTQMDNLPVTCIALLNITSCKVLLEPLNGFVTWYKNFLWYPGNWGGFSSPGGRRRGGVKCHLFLPFTHLWLLSFEI